MKNILIDTHIHAAYFDCLQKIPGVHTTTVGPVDDVRELPAEVIADKHIHFCSYPPKNFSDMKRQRSLQVVDALD